MLSVQTAAVLDTRLRSPVEDPVGTHPGSGIWSAVDELVGRAPRLTDLRAHGLQLLAARRSRALGEELSPWLEAEERGSLFRTLTAALVLERVRASYDGPLMLIKGLEVAALYPDPALRPFGDVDVLAAEPEAAHAALVGAGFEPAGHPDSYYAERHHLRPLVWPGLPFAVEIHRRPEWPKWTAPPPADELFAAAVPSSAGVDGMLAPSRLHHALIVGAHSWSGAPLGRLLDLVDFAVLAEGIDRAEGERLARRWGVGGVWRTTLKASDALLQSGPPSWALRLWARDLPRVRDRTVLADHLRPLAASFWALPFHRAIRVAAGALAQEFRPVHGESWSTKLVRSRRAIRNAFSDLSEHEAFERPARRDE